MTTPAAEVGDAARDTPKRRLGPYGIAFTLFGLCGLAVGLPVLSVLGPSATFFTAHGAGASDVVAFTAVVVIVPALCATAAIFLLRLALPTVAPLVEHIAVGGLTAAVLLPAMGARSLPARVFAPVGLLVAAAIGVLHAKKSEVRFFLRLSVAGPVVLAVWFLFISATSGIVLPRTGVAGASEAKDANVVYIVFDEFPLAVLLDGDGAINADRFPGFARLASRSSWYRHATTVAPWTNLAVPAMLSGRMPVANAKATHYSRNLFSMLAPTHDLVTMEYVTHLCQVRGCDTEAEIRAMYKDASILYGHRVLPESAAKRWLPPLGDRWANFAKPSDPVPGRHGKEASDQGARFGRLLDAMRPGSKSKLWFGHFILPHFPLKHLPDGRLYDRRHAPFGVVGNTLCCWQDNRPAQALGRQRFVLQMRYVDKLIGDLVETLEERDLMDDTMIVVGADHGLSFSEGSRRGVPYSIGKAPEMLPVPLFVKYPGQQEGAVVEPPVQTVDILPTIAHELDAQLDLDWDFDGRNLREADRGIAHRNRYYDGGPKATPPDIVDVMPAVRDYLTLFGEHRSANDVYAWGPHADLVGRPAPEGGAAATPAARLVSRKILANNDEGLTPALVEVAFDGDRRPDWFAVAVNGRISGLGRTLDDEGYGMAMTDPSRLRNGRNDVRVFAIGDDGALDEIRLS